MDSESFKQQQQDRIEEGKDLKREDELKDLSQIPSKELPVAQSKSLFSKISQGISNVASTISEKVGLSEPTMEGHEDLDKDVRKQIKKVNKEILKEAAKKGPEVEKTNEWEHNLERHVKKEGESLKSKAEDKLDVKPAKPVKPSEGVSLPERVQHSIHGVSESISQGVDSIKQRFTKEKEEEINEDGTKNFRSVKDGFNETVDHLNHEKRVEELGGQENLTSKNPFQPLTSGNNEPEDEGRTLGEKVKGGLSNVSKKFSSTAAGVSQKVKYTFVHKENTVEDKENAPKIA